MKEEAQATGSRRNRWLQWMALALVLYVLSIGPVNAVLLRHAFNQERRWAMAKAFYSPLRPLEWTGAPANWILQYELWWDGWLPHSADEYPFGEYLFWPESARKSFRTLQRNS